MTEASTSRPQKKHKSKVAISVVAPRTEMQPANDARVKSRKGKLRNMTEMPIDILFEIFGKLEPIDLLHLSRANKDLRAILIASAANFLWEMVCFDDSV